MITQSDSVAIFTTEIGATANRPARIKAAASMNRAVIVPYCSDERETRHQAHERACLALCAKFDWVGDLVAGGTEDGFAFVFTGRES